MSSLSCVASQAVTAQIARAFRGLSMNRAYQEVVSVLDAVG